MKKTNEQVKEYFIKLCLEGDSINDLAEELWNRMSAKERKKYKEELEGYDGELE